MTIEHPTAGRSGHLTEDQQAALTQLQRDMVADGKFDPARHNEHMLLRFLRARRFDLPKTKLMLYAYEQWRTDFGVDQLVKEFTFPEADLVRALYPQYYHGTDKLGRPIYIEHLGHLDVRKLTAVTTMDRMQQKHVFEYEKTIDHRFPACSKRAPNGPLHIEQSCTILDLAGVSLMSFSQVASFVKQVSKIGQDYYPEMLGTMFIVNAPMLFSSVWSLIKPFLDEVTVKKIHILGSGFKKSVLEYVDEDVLPKRLGGKCQCPGGCEQSDIGPWNEVSVEEIEADKVAGTEALTALMNQIKAELEASA
ncbi:cytosolic factor, phosphatidylinositol/phosphatidylcholine transfer protein [Allomyces javanicus]|nr:cytosolic factor, phosphatidylinositol/phosphatidylcholine transfer protein [Allomyces javanicus]